MISFFLFVAFFLSSCATYETRIQAPRAAFEMEDYDRAIELLNKEIERDDRNQLLYLMDLGMVYHTAGQYEKAIETFLKADKLAEIKDYTSLSAEAVSVLMNDEIKQYSGEDFEKVLINMYLAIDFALLGKWESALVEARRVNHKLDRMRIEGKLPYERNAFAKYLSAILFEAQKEWNDALVDYRQLYTWKGALPYLAEPLLNTAAELSAAEEIEFYKTKFNFKGNPKRPKNQGEIILLLEEGRAPIKVPHPNFSLLPKFHSRTYGEGTYVLRIGNEKAPAATYEDIEKTAIRELDHRVTMITTKKIAGIVAKQAAAYGVEKATNSKLAGFLTAIALHATDKADLRSWSTLPARLEIARLRVAAGRQDIFLDRLGGGEPTTVKTWKGIDVKPGQLIFLSARTRD